MRKLVESQEKLLPEEELRKRPRLLGGGGVDWHV